MATSTVDGDLRVNGSLNVTGTIGPARVRSELATETSQVYGIPWTQLRVWDAVQTVLPTAGNDDLGLLAGAFATGCWYVTAGNVRTLGSTTRYARFTFTLPPEYVAGGAVAIRFSGGLLTTVADVSCTVDAECYKSNRDTLKTGSDLCATAAQSMNSLTFSNLSFTITPTTLAAGDELDVRIAIISNDAATAGAVTPALAAIEILASIRG